MLLPGDANAMALQTQSNEPPSNTVPRLRVSVATPDAPVVEYQFEGPFRIGREDSCEICIKNEYVSRKHADISFENGQWWIKDLNSSNGLYLGEQRTPGVAIENGTTIRLGISGPGLRFEIEKPAPKLSPP